MMEFHLRAPLSTDLGIWLHRIPEDGISSSCTAINNQLIRESGFIVFQIHGISCTAINNDRDSYQLIRESGFVEFQIHGISSSCTAINNRDSHQLIRESGFIGFQRMEFHLHARLSTDFGIWLHRIPDGGISSSCTAIDRDSHQLIRESGFIEFQRMEFHLRAPL